MAEKRIEAAQVAGASPKPPAARARRTRQVAHEVLLARMQTAPEADSRMFTVAAAVLDEASRAGLLDSATEHVSFRAPKALLEAAKRETGLTSTTELGLVALAALARPDPVCEAMKRTRGKPGKPEKRTSQLSPRLGPDLVSAVSVSGARRLPLVPDTTVHIHNAAGILPADVERLVDRALPWHCSVRLGEIMAGIANYSPSAPDWGRVKEVCAVVLDAIPDRLVLVPDTETWLSACLISGTLARTQGLQCHQRKELLNDALIYRRRPKPACRC